MDANPDSIPTRQSLLGRLKSFDNAESWKEFFDTYWGLIYSMAIRSELSDAEAQDVVQETIISVARSMPTFEYNPAVGSFKGWLRKLTRWRIIDHIRSRNGTPIPISQFASEPLLFLNLPDESDASFEAIWEEEWKRMVIDLATERTKRLVHEKQFQIFDLCTVRRWPIEKVASALKIGRGRVYVSNHRVKRVFERELKNLNLEKIK
jgi:RNA polymerase sigma factor (sigma-70 family)